MKDVNDLTEQIIGAAIEVHRALGPGLLESAYQRCMYHELDLRRLLYLKEHPLPVAYKGCQLDCGYRLDLLVERLVVVEIKSVEKLDKIHDAQLITYLKLAAGRLDCSSTLTYRFCEMAFGVGYFDSSSVFSAISASLR